MIYELRCEKSGLRGCDLVPHKQSCTAIEDGLRLEILDLGSRGIVICSKNKGADKLHSNCAADLRLCFPRCKNQFLS